MKNITMNTNENMVRLDESMLANVSGGGVVQDLDSPDFGLSRNLDMIQACIGPRFIPGQGW